MDAEPQFHGKSCGHAYALCAGSSLLVLLAGAPLQLWSVPVGLAWTEFLILLPAILYVRKKGVGVVRGLAWHPVAAGVAMRSVELGVTAWGVAGALYYLVSHPIFGDPPRSTAMLAQSWPHLLVLLLVGAFLPGICEEALFRGAIFGILQRKTAWKAVIISAALFAIYHLNPWNLIPAFFLGVLFGVMRTRTGSAVPSMIAHACCNATAFTVAFLAGEVKDGSLAPLVFGVPSLLFGFAAWEFCRHTRPFVPGISPLANVPAALPRRFWLVVGLVVVIIVGLLVALRVALHKPRSKAAAKKVTKDESVSTPALPAMHDFSSEQFVIPSRDSRTQVYGKIVLLQTNAVKCCSPAMFPDVRKVPG